MAGDGRQLAEEDGEAEQQSDASATDASATDASATDASATDASTTDASSLRAADLALSYPTMDEPVVECDRIDIPAGEVTALVGPNGSGKSTMLKALAKQLEPDRGHVVLDGASIQELDSKELARRLGLLSQENEAPGSLTVEDLVYHGRYPHRGFFESVNEDDEAAVERALDLAGVDHLRNDEVGNLSGGQKQLAWIAMVLAQETDVLLLDEPTTYLDLHHQLRVMEVVRTLNRERDVTVAVVLHDLGQAARFADNLIAMKDGELYDWGPPRTVVSEELLRDVFRVDADVDAEHPTGPHISPHRALDE
ncbi:iron complex transport system ATP-binding protein [Halogranum gelatinilyticum]|uniref:Cobalamin import ATP-binding protein BtuD n=1 Tax=Halogranum gelatinilyticum TaxID=660521 RepID=A0A1G9QY38_9EURY|nr:ABC transporter ATP-binding protein [Halogranum gelatinilyticum]SDM15952.1 iron complex transport system ATP-binding protein [Halogranum gelatinilyticum]